MLIAGSGMEALFLRTKQFEMSQMINNLSGEPWTGELRIRGKLDDRALWEQEKKIVSEEHTHGTSVFIVCSISLYFCGVFFL